MHSEAGMEGWREGMEGEMPERSNAEVMERVKGLSIYPVIVE